MYSMVLMAALTTGSATPAFGHHWHGCCGCWGGGYGCHGCCGCWGGYGCHGCWGGWGHGCHGCWGGWGHGCHGGWGYGCHGCCGCWGGYDCHGCCGGWGYACHGCCGGYGGEVVYPAPGMVPPMGAPAGPPVENVPAEKVPTAPKKTTSTQLERAQLVVDLPTDAKLFVDGKAVKTGAAKRTFNTPPLEAGQAYYYMLRAEVVRDGQTVEESTRVIVRAGEVARASFPTLEATATSTASSR